jgi:hypothetical protein
MKRAIILSVIWTAVHITIALGLGFVAHSFMLWPLDDGDAFRLTQWGWIQTAQLRALPWQIVGLLIAWGFLAIARACVDERDGRLCIYLPWIVALSGFAILSVILTASGIEFVIRKPYF